MQLIRDNFVRTYRGFELYDYQREPSNAILKSVINNEGRVFLIEYSRQSGKTEGISLTTSFLSLALRELMLELFNKKIYEFNVGIFAPQKEQAKTDFDKIKDILRNPRILRDFNIGFQQSNGNTIKLSNGNTIFCFSASPTSNTESKTLHLIILEEAQGLMDEKVKNTILPMGTDTNATVVYIGTAGYRRCLFYDSIVGKLHNQKSFIYDYRRIVAEKYSRYLITGREEELNYFKFLKGELGKVGVKVNSPEELIKLNHETVQDVAFQTQYGLLWKLEKGQFITPARLELLKGTHEIINSDMKKLIAYYAGIDFGKMHDSTVLTIGNNLGQIVHWLELHGEDYETQFLILMKRLKLFNIVSLCCDASANQDQIVDRFDAVMSPLGVTVEGVNFGTTKSDMYKNLDFMTRPVYNESGELISEARITFPKTDCVEKEKCFVQLLDLQKEIDERGRWKCAHPEGTNYHDDYPDSLGLYAWNFTMHTPLYTNLQAAQTKEDEPLPNLYEETIEQKMKRWQERQKHGGLH